MSEITRRVPRQAELRFAPATTAPWDQPRNATTITLRGPGVETATEAELLERLRERSPHLVEPSIDIVHSRRSYHGEPGEACCLISWRNPGVEA